MEIITANLVGRGQYRTWQNRHYFVAPIRMLVPGVLNGSMGPLLYPEEEVRKDPESWNGMPMVSGHPAQNGSFISARNPVIIERSGVGSVYYARANPTLDAEGWFDVDACRRVDGRILQALEERKPIEVSTGVVTRNYAAPAGAVFNGKDLSGKPFRKPYIAIARDYKPDHLAILMDTAGACSTKDGCGVLVSNALGGGMVELPKPNEITPRAKELGADAVRQGAIQGEVPDWVTDVLIWAQAREMADAGSYDESIYFAAVAQIYLLLDGKVGRTRVAATTAANTTPQANANPGQPKADDGRYKKAGSHEVRQAVLKGFGTPTFTPPATSAPPATDDEANRQHSPAAVFGVALNTNPQTTGVNMNLSDAERTRLIDGLVANCACETTRAQRKQHLAQQTDDTLKVLVEAQQWASSPSNPHPPAVQGQQTQNVATPQVQGQGQQHTQQQGQGQQPQTPGTTTPQQTQVPMGSGTTSPLLAGLFPPMTPNQPAAMSMDQWLGAMPPQAREVWNASQEIFNAAKMAIISQLVGNVVDTNQKVQLVNYYGTKSLEELRLIHMGMMASMPPPVAPPQQAPTQPMLSANWFGAAGGNPQPQPVTEEPLNSPVYNFSAARQATKQMAPPPAANGSGLR